MVHIIVPQSRYTALLFFPSNINDVGFRSEQPASDSVSLVGIFVSLQAEILDVVPEDEIERVDIRFDIQMHHVVVIIVDAVGRRRRDRLIGLCRRRRLVDD